MIFDKKLYDRSLWLMLKADKDNRDRIIEFINDIPFELRKRIEESIRIYKMGIKDNSILYGMEDKRLSGSYETVRHVLYWYNIDVVDSLGTLTLGYSILYGDMYYEVIEMQLVPYDDLYRLKYFDNEVIGNLMYDITMTKNFVSGKEKKYDIINTPFGDFILLILKDRNDKYRYELCKINIEKIPDNICIRDFQSKKNIKRLIRGKK